MSYSNQRQTDQSPGVIKKLTGKTGKNENLQSEYTDQPSQSYDKPADTSYLKQAQNAIGVTGIGSGHTNANVSGHYKKASNFEGAANSSIEGNVIDPNDNSNVKYSSMVDPVITSQDVEEARIRKSAPSESTHSTSTTTGGGRSGAAVQPIGAQNVVNDRDSTSAPKQGANIDPASKSAIPSTQQKHHSEGLGYESTAGTTDSSSTARNTAGGGLIGGIIGAVTGNRSNSNATDTSSSYSTQHPVGVSGNLGSGAGAHANTTGGVAATTDATESSRGSSHGDALGQDSTTSSSTAQNAAGGGIIGGIIGAVTGRSSSSATSSPSGNTANTAGFSNDARDTVSGGEFREPTTTSAGGTAYSDHSNVPGGFPSSQTQSQLDPTTNATTLDPARNTSGYSDTTGSKGNGAGTAAAGAAGGGILGSIFGAATGRGNNPQTSTRAGEGAYEHENVESTNLYSTGNPNYAETSSGPTPGATKAQGKNSHLYDESAADSDASVASLRGAPGTTGSGTTHGSHGTAAAIGGAGVGAAGAAALGSSKNTHQSGTASATTGDNAAFASSSKKTQEDEIHALDREIAQVEANIRNIESELNSHRQTSQQAINSREHEFSDSNYGGGAALAAEKRAVDSKDTKAYGSKANELKSIRQKQGITGERLAALQKEREQAVARAQQIDSELAAIQQSVASQNHQLHDTSAKNREAYTESDHSRTLKNGPVSAGAITNKRQLEIDALEDRLTRLRLQTDDLDHKLKSGGDSGNIGKTEQGYNDRSLDSSSGHGGAAKTGALGAAAGAVGGAALGSSSGHNHKSSSGDNYNSVRTGHGSTRLPAGGDQPTSYQKPPATSSGKDDAAVAAATAATVGGGGAAASHHHNHKSSATHSAAGVERHRSVHDPENSVYPGHETAGPEDTLVTGSGATASKHRTPYGAASNDGQSTTSKPRGGDTDVVDAGETYTSSPSTAGRTAGTSSSSGVAGNSASKDKQQSGSSKQIDSDKAGSKAQKLLEKIPGLGSKKAAAGGAAVAAGAVAGNAALSGQSKESATEQGKQAADHQQAQYGSTGAPPAGGSTTGTTGATGTKAGGNFDQEKFGNYAGQGLQKAGVEDKYAGVGGTAAGAGAGYAASKYGQGHSGTSNAAGSTNASQSATSGTKSTPQGSSQGASASQGNSSGATGGQGNFDQEKFGNYAGQGLQKAGVEDKYAGVGGTAAGAGAGYAASKYGQGHSSETAQHGTTGTSSAPQGSRNAQSSTGQGAGFSEGQAHKLGAQAEQYSQKVPGVDKTKAAGIGAAATAGGVAAAAAMKNHEANTQSSSGYQNQQHAQTRAGPAGAPYNSDYTDHERTNHGTSHHANVGPAGAPTDQSYVTGEGDQFNKTAATDSPNNIGHHSSDKGRYGTAAGVGAGAGAGGAALASHHHQQQTRAGPAGAPNHSEYTDHEQTDHSGIGRTQKSKHANVGPAGAPTDQSYVTGEGDDYSKTAATDSPNNIGKHQASKYPNESAANSKHTGSYGPGAIGGVGAVAGAGAGAAAAHSSSSQSHSRTTSEDTSQDSSLKKKIQNALKIGGKKDKGELHGTTYGDGNYNTKAAYRARDDTTYNTGDENLGDPQHPNTQQFGGSGGVLGAGIASGAERDRYQAAQGEKTVPSTGASNTATTRTGDNQQVALGDDDYNNATHANEKPGHGTATKTDPRTGKDVTGSATQAENLNREAELGTGAAGASAAAAGVAASRHAGQKQPQTQNYSGATVGGTDRVAAQQQADDDFINIKVVGAHDKSEAAAIAAAVVKENRVQGGSGSFTTDEVIIDADEFKASHGSNFMNKFSDNDKAVVQQMEHAASGNTAHNAVH